MCYYNGQRVSKAEYIRLKDLEKPTIDYDFLTKELLDGFSYGPTAVIIPNQGRTDFQIVQMQWGFIPDYIKNGDELLKMRRGYKDAKGKWHKAYTMLNAKGDELLLIDDNGKRKVFFQAAQQRRCLIPASEFYEWRHEPKRSKKTGEPLKGEETYPYHIAVKGQPYYFVAAVWQSWIDRTTGEVINTVALVTTAANSLMAQIHNSKKRMPTILTEELAYEWLFSELDDKRITEIATYQIPSSDLVAYTVAKDFRTSGTPDQPFVYEGLSELQHVA